MMTGFPGGSRERVNRAGRYVRDGSADDEDFAVINEWRAAHRQVINTFQASIRQRIRNQRLSVVVGQRLKRRSTIFDKLKRQPKMALGRMDDVAGIRLIFQDVPTLKAFRASFHAAKFQHERRNRDDQYDYLSAPKGDGYRGIHDVYAYHVKSKHAGRSAGLFIEIQYRTLVQHAWATANEVVGYVTGNETKFGRGDPRYLRIMALSSEILARHHEGMPGPLPEIDDAALLVEFLQLEKVLGINVALASMQAVEMKQTGKQNHILLFMHDGELQVREYAKNISALKALFRLELENPDSNVVLVGADSASQVEVTFRNYFTDTSDYLKLLYSAIDALTNRIHPKANLDGSQSRPLPVWLASD